MLRGVHLSIAPGELHGLVGQNGCGKSTLVKILTGVYPPDPGGSIAVDGRPLRTPVQPAEQRDAGVSVVHQNRPPPAQNQPPPTIPKLPARLDNKRVELSAAAMTDIFGADGSLYEQNWCEVPQP